MAVATLRPSGVTGTNNWTATGAADAAAALDDVVTDPTAPSTGSDFVATSTTNNVFEVALADPSLAAGRVISSIVAKVYCATTGTRRTLTLTLRYNVGGTGTDTVLATVVVGVNTAAAWQTLTASTAGLTDAELNSLRIRGVATVSSSTSTGTATAYAAYVDVTYTAATDYTTNPADTLSLSDSLTVTLGHEVTLSGFDPSTVSGLVAWWKADSLALNDGDAVATWLDSSINGRDATQATSGQRPVYKASIINGKPVVRFDRSLSQKLAFTPVSLSSGVTVFIVAAVTSVTQWGGPLTWQAASQIGFLMPSDLASSWQPHMTERLADGTEGLHSKTALTYDASPRVYGWRSDYTAGGTTPYIDAGAVTRQTGTSGWGSVEAFIGKGFDHFTGDIAEILVYNGVLSDTDVASIQDYLGGKYGLFGTGGGGGDAVTLTDSVTTASGISHNVTPSDNLTLSDALAAAVQKALADTATLSDATSLGVGESISDSLTLADALALQVGKILADTATLADDIATVSGIGYTVTPADSVMLADSLALGFGPALSDSASLADALATAAGINTSVADTATLADLLATAIGRDVQTADSATPSDTATPAVGIATAVDDTSSVADNLTTATGRETTADDSITVADNLQTLLERALTQAVDDTLALADALTPASGIAASIADTASVADALSRDIGRLVADLVSLADSATTELSASGDALTATITDTLTVADAIAQLAVSIGLAETITANDALSLSRDINVAKADSVIVADLVDVLLTAPHIPERPVMLLLAARITQLRLQG